ncbi:hypothetical protein JCM5353_008934 [Sporobolomyces roseus]
MTASAAPLLSRSTESTCSPVINGNYSTHIATAFNTRSAWKYVGSGEGSNGDYPVDTQVTDVGTMDPNPPGTDLTVSQWYGANAQYRIGVGKFNGVETCLGGRDDRIYGLDCDSALAAWTITCDACSSNDGSQAGICSFQATQVGTCATFTGSGQAMNLTECLPIDGENPDVYYQTNQQFIF